MIFPALTTTLKVFDAELNMLYLMAKVAAKTLVQKQEISHLIRSELSKKIIQSMSRMGSFQSAAEIASAVNETESAVNERLGQLRADDLLVVIGHKTSLFMLNPTGVELAPLL